MFTCKMDDELEDEEAVGIKKMSIVRTTDAMIIAVPRAAVIHIQAFLDP